jgi:hypothetical protein
MGRTLATFRELIEQELRGWERVFGRALRREERQYLEAMFNRVRLYIQACTYEFPVHAMDAINVALALDHEIRLRALEARLGVKLDAPWMDPRPLPLAGGNDAVADPGEREPGTPEAE